jgi:putative endonuclease
MRAKDGRGKYGESVAAQHLEAQGFEVLDRNWRCPQGELDIVARDGAALVFVEVKTRSSTRFGEPAEAVDYKKARRLRGLAAAWLVAKRPPYYTDMRFDVLSVLTPRSGPAQVTHLRDAI